VPASPSRVQNVCLSECKTNSVGSPSVRRTFACRWARLVFSIGWPSPSANTLRNCAALRRVSSIALQREVRVANYVRSASFRSKPRWNEVACLLTAAYSYLGLTTIVDPKALVMQWSRGPK